MLTNADRETRARRITSSTAAAILGLSPFATPLQAWMEITGRDAENDEPDEERDARFERGHTLEPALVEWCARVRERETLHPHHVERPKTRIAAPWAADSVDAILRAKPLGLGCECVEAKTASYESARAYGEDGTDQVPQHVALQCAWHMWAWDAPVCWVPALVGGGLELRLYVVRRDAEIESALVETCEEWHRVHVQGDTPPPATGADEQTLRRLFPRHRPDSMLPDDPALALLARRDVVLREQLATAKAERSAVRAEIQERLGEHEGCKGDGYSVSWRASKDQTRVDWESIVRELAPSPALIEKHTHVRPGPRVLRTTWRGE